MNVNAIPSCLEKLARMFLYEANVAYKAGQRSLSKL